MRKIAGILAGCLVVVSAAQAEGLYRWVDSEGRVHYGDRPEPDAAQVQAKKFVVPQEVPDDELLPYASKIARKNFPVTLYVTENCGDVCVQARNLLNKRGVPFTEKIIATQAENEAFEKLTGSTGIPTLAVGRTYLKGFEAGQWHSELDIAGYPKTAPFGVRPVPPAKPASAPVAASSPSDTPVPVEAAAPVQ